MNDLFFEELTNLKELSKYSITFGIHTEVGFQTLNIKLEDLDNNINEIVLSMRDILYLIDNGTVSVPSIPILGYIKDQIDVEIQPVLDKIVSDVFENNINSYEINIRLQEFINNINDRLPVIINNFLNDDISTLLELPKNTIEKIDPSIISKYIKCKLIKE